jgi:hypothetical protein
VSTPGENGRAPPKWRPPQYEALQELRTPDVY